jgi:hypothetical protein
MSLLAIALAEVESPARAYLRQYGEAHSRRILTPLIVLAGMGARRTWNLREAVPTILAIIDLGKYARSQQALTDSRETQIDRIGRGFDQAFRAFRSADLPDGVMEMFQDYIVTRVVDGIASLAAESSSSK